MGEKRQREDSEEEIRRQIRRLQNKLKEKENSNKRRRIRIIDSDSDEDAASTFGSQSSNEVLPCRSHSADRQSAARAVPPDDMPGASSSTERRPSSSPQQTQQTPVAGPSSAPTTPAATDAVPDKSLDDDILCLLGDAPTPETKLGEKVHEAIANRWQEILSKGLPKEVREKLVKDYLVPSNCELLVPPALNPEIKAALPEALVKRDFAILEKQKQLGIALAALSRAAELVASREMSAEKILKPLSDASRLLCDTHFKETKTRRNFVISAVSTDMKDTLTETPRSNLLFGDNVSEKVKSAKTIQRSGDALKGKEKTKFNRNNFINKDNNKNRLNSKAPHPRTASKSDAGRGRSMTSRSSSQRAPPRRAAAASERSPSPRRPRRRPNTRRY